MLESTLHSHTKLCQPETRAAGRDCEWRPAGIVYNNLVFYNGRQRLSCSGTAETKFLDLPATLFIIASKSGGAIESSGKEGQAISVLQSLEKHGRRAVRVSIDRDIHAGLKHSGDVLRRL